MSAAVRLIEQGGHEDFSLREAAREVGVSANAAYRHFADKSALVTAVNHDGFERLSRAMQAAMDQVPDSGEPRRDVLERFKAVGRAYVAFASEHPELFRLMFGTGGAAAVCGAPGAPLDLGTPSPYALLEQALDALVAAGLLSATQRPGAELKAWVVVHGFASLGLGEGVALPGCPAPTEALESVLQFAVIGLCADLPSRDLG